ncbi:YheU family protein [Teredinibacter turnerae]|uniref:YheU family protein n=1 Tax=Teredinibacter turnerae TaxID=2426 RepID=UPI000372DEC4|nr:YheU family protein [Teredinibacter turnerae]
MIIPPERLTEEALRGVIEGYITREGTDYGEHELSLPEKVEALMPQVVLGEVLIVFDEESESVNLVNKRDYQPPATETA